MINTSSMATQEGKWVQTLSYIIAILQVDHGISEGRVADLPKRCL